ncbi:MAG TPA: hypothetical protein DCG54_03605 [Anaerolineae bacterium]|jgi:hypothetical protein|nr:hypothetical protein [Anaerolineae bacterium]
MNSGETPRELKRKKVNLAVDLFRTSALRWEILKSPAKLITRQFLVWLVLILNWQTRMIFWLKNRHFSRPNNDFSVYNYRIDWYCLGGSLF